MSQLIKNIRFGSNGFNVQKLAQFIEDGYNEDKRERKIIAKTTFPPSGLAYNHGRCPRRHVMAFQGKWEGEDSVTAESLAIMSYGNEAHGRIQSAFDKSGHLIKNELEVLSDDPPIRGFVDSIVEVDGEEVVVEVKTTKEEYFVPKTLSMKGSYYHMYQLLTYMKILNKKHGALVYENKNDNSILVIPVDMTPENQAIIDEAFDWMRKVHKVYKDGQLPVRPWKKTSTYCKQCPLFDACWDEAPEGDIKVKPMKVHKW